MKRGQPERPASPQVKLATTDNKKEAKAQTKTKKRAATTTPSTLDVTITQAPSRSELKYKIPVYSATQASVPASWLVTKLEEQGCVLNGQQILYFSPQEQTYIYAGVYCKSHGTPNFEIPVSKREGLILRCRPARTDYLPSEPKPKPRPKPDNKNTRPKNSELTIEEAISKVVQWRQIMNFKERLQRGSTGEQAAEIIGMPKKTLDSYFSALKFGNRYAFDFNYYRKRGMGLLRAFTFWILSIPLAFRIRRLFVRLYSNSASLCPG